MSEAKTAPQSTTMDLPLRGRPIAPGADLPECLAPCSLSVGESLQVLAGAKVVQSCAPGEDSPCGIQSCTLSVVFLRTYQCKGEPLAECEWHKLELHSPRVIDFRSQSVGEFCDVSIFPPHLIDAPQPVAIPGGTILTDYILAPLQIRLHRVFVNYDSLEVLQPSYLKASGIHLVGTLPTVSADTSVTVNVRARNPRGFIDTSFILTITP